MLTRSSRWDSHIIASHTAIITADVLYAGVAIVEGLAVAAGGVVLDRTAAIRGRCSVDLAEPALIPNGAGDPLSPFGYELQLRRGITYTDGTNELMPLGVFGIQRSKADGVELLSSIDGLDRAQKVADARMEDDYAIASGTNYATAIQALLAFALPTLTFSFASTPHTTPALVVATQEDPWAKALDMAKAIGCELFMDGNGVCVLRPEPSASTTPSWIVAEGANGVLVSASISLDRAPACNRVIASGTNMGNVAQYTGTATDNTPNSPTYYFGPFGKKPRFYSSPLLASTAQCESAAAGILAGNIGVAKSVDFSAVPNPAVEPGDSVQIVHSSLGLDEIHIIDRLTIPLTARGAMTADTRQVSA